jgi:DNA repair exonuclease SbcCD nuclease subunit
VAVVVHTADVHLGAPLGWLGEAADAQRHELRSTFARVVDLAVELRADALIVAGDLFDSTSPPASDVRFALSELSRYADETSGTAVVLPGSHDHLGTGTVYESYRQEFLRAERVVVLGLDGRTVVELTHRGLAIHGRALAANASSERPLAGLAPSQGIPINIAAAHGSMETVPGASSDHPVSERELRSGWSYVALGHWHSWKQVAENALYAGAPEIVAPDQEGAGAVAVVRFSEHGPRIERVETARRRVRRVELEIDDGTVTELAARLRGTVPPSDETILLLTLCGLVDADAGFDDAELVELLAENYFHVAAPERAFHVRLDEESLSRLPSEMVVGRFARLMRSRIEATADPSGREELEDALQLGVSLLQGREL